MAVANSLAAVRAGARQVEFTFNGIGERAGNCSLEEFTMALTVRHGIFGLHTGIDTKRLFPTSRLLSSITGMPVQNVIRAALPWIGCLLLSLVAVTFVPAASTWLPALMLQR